MAWAQHNDKTRLVDKEGNDNQWLGQNTMMTISVDKEGNDNQWLGHNTMIRQ